MGLMFSGKVFSGVINDNVNFYYSDHEWNARLGTAEKFHVELKASNVTGTGPNITVSMESSADGVNWVARITNPASMPNLSPSGTLSSGSVIMSYDLGTSYVGGRFTRFKMQMGGTSPNAYIELWVSGRTAV
jgi:hypothetical protein